MITSAFSLSVSWKRKSSGNRSALRRTAWLSARVLPPLVPLAAASVGTSLHFKKVGDYWSVRVGDRFRALATRNGERVTWFWIGPHGEYLRMIRD